MPEWLLKRLNGARNGSRDRSGWQTPAPMVEGDIPEHERNSTLASLAGTMRRRGFHEDAISAALLVTNRDRCKPPLDDADVRAIAHSVARYDPSAEAVGSLDELTALLALDTVGKRIDVVRLYGRGSNAIAHIYLDDGERIVLDPVGKFTTCSKMNAEVAIQAGASVTLRPPDVTRVLVLLRNLSERHELVGRIEERSWEFGVEYLRAAVIGDVVMADQASRGELLSRLNARTRRISCWRTRRDRDTSASDGLASTCGPWRVPACRTLYCARCQALAGAGRARKGASKPPGLASRTH